MRVEVGKKEIEGEKVMDDYGKERGEKVVRIE